MTDGRPDALPHRRYTVTLRKIDGSTKDVRVITNRGPTKAVYLAAGGPLRRWDALDVEVRDDGPPELDVDGVPILRGFAFDRNEW